MANNIRGFDSLLRQLRQFGEAGNRMASAIVQSTADKIVLEAKVAAPKDKGTLTRSISKTPSPDGLTAYLSATAKYGPYQEFGTGQRVAVPAEFYQLAIQYKIGDGSKKGIFPKPYLIPAFIRGRAELPRKMQSGFDRLVSQYNAR